MSNKTFKLAPKFQKRLNNANAFLLAHGGKEITTIQAIDFNATHHPQSGREGGEIAIEMIGGIDSLWGISDRRTMQIGDALIDISREYSGVDIY